MKDKPTHTDSARAGELAKDLVRIYKTDEGYLDALKEMRDNIVVWMRELVSKRKSQGSGGAMSLLEGVNKQIELAEHPASQSSQSQPIVNVYPPWSPEAIAAQKAAAETAEAAAKAAEDAQTSPSDDSPVDPVSK